MRTGLCSVCTVPLSGTIKETAELSQLLLIGQPGEACNDHEVSIGGRLTLVRDEWPHDCAGRSQGHYTDRCVFQQAADGRMSVNCSTVRFLELQKQVGVRWGFWLSGFMPNRDGKRPDP